MPASAHPTPARAPEPPMRRNTVLAMTLIGILLFVACAAYGATSGKRWSADEIEELRGLWIGSLESLPADPTNRWADDSAAALLGHQLFFETKLSSNGRVSCATCHAPDRDFQDGTRLGHGVGTTDRRTMPVTGTAHSP